jgi:PAS domain-containing protein
VNAAFENPYGYRREEALGQNQSEDQIIPVERNDKNGAIATVTSVT